VRLNKVREVPRFGLIVADYSNACRLRKRKDLKPEERAWLEARSDFYEQLATF